MNTKGFGKRGTIQITSEKLFETFEVDRLQKKNGWQVLLSVHKNQI